MDKEEDLHFIQKPYELDSIREAFRKLLAKKNGVSVPDDPKTHNGD